jgi:hypothetical protein
LGKGETLMKLIPLTQGLFAMVDDEDYQEVIKSKWQAWKSQQTYYATRRPKGKETSRMHRLIMGDIKNITYDHIDGNGLNNQKSNLRVATCMQNNQNRGKKINSKSKYKGVSWKQKEEKWYARAGGDKNRYSLGFYDTEEAAAKAYDKKAKELFGEFARLNFKENE